MPQIVLSEDQARVIVSALEPVQVCGPDGKVLGSISPFWTAEDIAEARRRLASDQPRYTTAQVLEYLRTLDSK